MYLNKNEIGVAAFFMHNNLSTTKVWVMFCLILNTYLSILLKKVSNSYRNILFAEFCSTPDSSFLHFPCTGCLNLLCPTSNQHFLRLKWHSKQKPSIFGMLSRGDLCLVHRFIYFCFVHSLYRLGSSGCRNSSFLKPCSLHISLWG